MECTDVLTCSVCIETFNDPRFLPCGHTFCSRCIDGVIERELGDSESADMFCCPNCRNPSDIPELENDDETWACHFSPNYVVKNLVSLPEKQEDKPQINHCKHHKKDLEYFCDQHKISICSKCFFNEHRVCSNVQNIEDSTEYIKLLINNRLNSVKEGIDKFDSLQKNIALKVDASQDDQKSSISKVESFFNDLREKADVFERKLKNEIVNGGVCTRKNMEQKRSEVMGLVSCYRKVTDDVAADIEKCEEKEKLAKAAEKVKKSSQELNHDFQKIIDSLYETEFSLSCDENVLVSLLHSSSSLSRITTRNGFGNDSYLQSDQGSHSSQKLQRLVSVYDPNLSRWKFNSMRDIRHGGREPLVSFVTPSELLVAYWDPYILKLVNLNTSGIKKKRLASKPYDMVRYDQVVAITMCELEEIHVFPLSSLNTPHVVKTEKGYHGITRVQGNFYVACSSERRIKCVNDAGVVLKTSGRSSDIPRYLSSATDEGPVVIGYYNTSHVVGMSPDLRVLWTFRHEELSGPRGMCRGFQDHVLISSCQSSRILEISKDGKFLRTVVNSNDGLNECRSAYLDTNTNMLAVGLCDGVVKLFLV